jgi:hypothetical protein
MNARCIGPRLFDRAQSFDGADATALQGGDRREARENRATVHDHRARAALAQAAPEFGAVQLQVVAQYIKEWRVAGNIQAVARFR